LIELTYSIPLNVNDLLLTLAIFIIVLTFTLILMPSLIRKLRRMGITGIDYHKIAKPEIPEMGGIGILAGIMLGGILAVVLFSEERIPLLSAMLMIATAASVGLVDDLKTLGPKTKPLLTALACWPLFLFQTYDPYPVIPLIGGTRMTIIYPILVIVGAAMAANAVNMLDVLNGAMPSTCIPVAIALLACSIIVGSTNGMILSAILTSSLIAYYRFNKFPAKVFSGDVGSFAVGTTIATIAIIGRLEVAAVVAMIPFIMNSFHSLASIGRLFERRQIKQRPTILLKDGRIAANPDAKAPLTLTRIIVGRTPLRENEVVKVLSMLCVLSSILAIITVLVFL
jgi:UDP-N-acetylglucosamine--dolichyl-phosphate N-acetylglucosaminephosphotransferase